MIRPGRMNGDIAEKRIPLCPGQSKPRRRPARAHRKYHNNILLIVITVLKLYSLKSGGLWVHNMHSQTSKVHVIGHSMISIRYMGTIIILLCLTYRPYSIIICICIIVLLSCAGLRGHPIVVVKDYFQLPSRVSSTV